MRIAQVTYSYQPIVGGADVWAQLLRRVCEAAGHEVAIYQRPMPDLDDPAVRVIRSPLSSVLGKRGEFWSLPLGLPRLRKELAQYEVLVVHYPNYHRFLEWHSGTVLVSHGVFWDDRPSALRNRIKKALARRAYREATFVVANDTFFLREVGEDVRPGAEPFTQVAPGRFFVPNCVDTRMFTRTEPHPDLRDGPLVLVPRNVYRNRGIHLAIEALGRCVEELDGARMVVAGAESQPRYAAYCRRLAAQLGISDRVHFIGPIPWEQMPAAYSAADLTVIPTIAGEGTSLSALEAMACGTATVTTKVAGLADLPTIKSEPTAEALAAAMVKAWRNRPAIAAEQQQAVRSVYNLENWRQAWLEILQRLD